MIIAHHYVIHSGAFDPVMPPLNSELIFFLTIQALGKIGVMIFFTISAWYLCMEKQPTMLKALKRSWILEREVLFYSLGLCSVFLVFAKQYLSIRMTAFSLFPTISGMWWYVTAYVIFLLLCPSLTRGLRAVGEKVHASLCALLLIGWGIIAGLLPIEVLESNTSGFVGFLFIYILVSFYRWYLDDWSSKIAWIMVAVGSLLIVISILSIQLLGTALNSDRIRAESTYLASGCIKPPVLLVGFGLMLLFEKRQFTNKLINAIASTTFGVYLIHDYVPIREVLWHSRFGLKTLYNEPYAVPESILTIIIVFLFCMMVDFVRQGLFTITIDRRRGYRFNQLYTYITSKHWIQQLNQHLAEKPLPHQTLITGKDLLDQADEPIPPTINDIPSSKNK